MDTRKLILIPLFIIFGLCTFAQDQNSKYVDSATLAMFYRQSWDSLISAGEKAIDNNIDYFYLRYRLGKAYMAKGKPIKAIHHFEKAKNFNGDDLYNLDALYYAYLMGNKQLEARYLLSKFSPDIKSKYEQRKSIFSEIYFEAGYTESNNIQKNKDLLLLGTGIPYAEQDMAGSSLYSHLGTKLNIGARSQFYVGLSTIEIDKIKSVQAPNLAEMNPPSPGKPPIRWIEKSEESYKLNQQIGYLSHTYLINPKTKITTSGQLLYLKTENIDALPSFLVNPLMHDTVKFLTIQKTDTSFINYALSLNISRRIRNTELNVFGSFSELNGNKQKQAGLGLYYYPFGNFKLYGYTGLTGFKEKSDKRLIIDQMIGIKVAKKLWTETSYTYGNLTNYTDKNAFVVLNISDNAKNRFGLNLIYSVNSAIDFSINYQYINRESIVTRYEDPNNNVTYQYNKYFNHTIIGGIKWKL